MTPTPLSTERPSPPQLDDDEIVITGLSGLFPNCNNVTEFSEKLYKHENLVNNTNVRWDKHNTEAPEYYGIVPNLDEFDAQFFMIHYHLCTAMDPMSRKLLEQAYQAVFDAGISPEVLSGTKLGVFFAVSLTECEKILGQNSGFSLTGTNRPMFANRISFLFNGKGPSMTIDSGCSGSLICLQKAIESMRRGDCDSAIVGGSHITLHAHASIHYGRMFQLNSDGKMKCFDKNADGQSLSECISVIFLQKAKDAKRIYATVCDVDSEFGRGLNEIDHYNRYGPQRDPSKLFDFYNEFYKKANISPLDVEYVEAFGSAFPEADKAELEAIQEVFCKNRNDPLFIGSVMSNMGCSQAATTIAALTKMCLAYQTGKISANLHYETPRTDIAAICDGRMRVVTENMPFSRSYTAINNMSFAGMNGHVLLKGRYKPKVAKRYESKIPYLLAVSGRQESAVDFIFEDFKKHPLDPEEIALIHSMNKVRITKHLARGYTILMTDENQKTVSVKEKVEYYDDAKKPLWFVFSGMGSQWNGMGKELMRLPIFAASIHKCHKILEPMGLDLLHILTTDDKKIFDNILNSFVGITAVQIGLTDVLKEMGLVPDNIIGHSVGELPCAYADGCLSAEQVMLSSYYRGLVSLETSFIYGRMAAVGLGYQEIQPLCPQDIEVACHNSSTSSTLSGPADSLLKFVETLNSKGIFAKEVNTSNIAYHSSYVKDAGPALLQYLKKLITDPKPRSEKWLSTSVPKEAWETPEAQLCSAEYFTNNLLNPVLFEETAEAIPVNAVLVEIAPHGLLQAILRRSLPETCANIPLTRRGHSDNARYLLEAIGELFMVGLSPDISVLYPKVEFPVSTETRPLSHLLEWAYGEKWKLPVYTKGEKHQAAAYDVALSTHDPEFSFLRGHIIDDDTLYPFAAALVLVWDTLTMSMGLVRKEMSVQFREVYFYTQPPLSDNQLMKLSVEIHRGSGKFQVVNENVLIVTGFIEQATNDNTSFDQKQFEGTTFDKMEYSSNDIYRMLYDRGYKYRGEFRSLQKENAKKTHALISWEDNWVTLIDAAIQMNALRREGDILEQPRFIQRLFIDVKYHNLAVQTLKEKVDSLEAYYHEDKEMIRCGGLVLEGLLFGNISPRKRNCVGLKSLQFTPYIGKHVVDVSTALFTILQILEENKDSTMNVLEITDMENGSYLGNKIKQLLPELSSINLNMKRMTKKDISESNSEIVTPDFMLVDDILTDKNLNDALARVFPPKIFAIVLEEGTISQSIYKVVTSAITPIGRLVLGCWRPQRTVDMPTVVSATSTKDIINLTSARNNLPPRGSLYILTQYPPIKELQILVSLWRKEQKKNKVFMAMVDKTSIQNLDAKQLPDFDLSYSVLHNGAWGGYYFTRGGTVDGKEQRTVVLKSATMGDVDSLHWTEAPELNPNDIPVTVHYAGLNFYDAKKAIGDILASPEEVTGQQYGMDFSGVTDRGERVMGVVSGGAAASRVAAQPSLLWPVPDHWTLEDAATVPLAYAHAFYCFELKSDLRPGMSVLIHGGAGALGQAAITIALANKCTVFTTVSDTKKKRFLMELFPQLNEDYIGYSRNYSFGDMIMEETKGKGCDIIISCVKGDMKHITLSSCGAHGTTLDTQEVHSKEPFKYGMWNMMKCRTYIVTDFSTVFAPESIADMKKLQVMVSDGIARGYVRPLSRVVYGAHDAARGLRLLAASRHRGKVLVRIHGEDLLATNRLLVQAYSSNLVLSAAEDDALAVRIVDLLISRGAINIVLHRLKNEDCKPDMYLDDKMKQWKKLGAKVKKVFGNLNSTAKVEELIMTCGGLGPVDGVYVIADAPVTVPKEILSSLMINLDVVTRKTCPTIRRFCIINNNGDIGRDICINRTLGKLPGLMLQIQCTDKFTDTNGNVKEICTKTDSVSLKNVMEYVESALCITGPVAVVYSYRQEESLMEKVSSITKLKLMDERNDTKMTLRDLGLNTEQTQKLIQLLHNYNVILAKNEILALTIRELKTLQNNQVKSRPLTGLEVLYSSVETDEVFVACELVSLPTPIQKSSPFQRDDGFDPNAAYLVMVPGMDGHYRKFESLCERIKLCAVACQPGFDHPRENIFQMAERLTKVILKKLQPKERFYLLGYSFGVLVALEMAAILEQHGLTGVVFCVDASPDTFPTLMNKLLLDAGANDGAKLQNAFVQHMYSLLAGSSSDRLISELEGLSSWNEKVEAGIRVLKEEGYSMQFVRAAMETAYSRIDQTRQYDSRQQRTLNSQLVLLRCRTNQTVSPDLGLSRYSKCKPHVYDLTADHSNALDDLRCATIINSYLDKSILDDFYKMNLCNSYVHITENYGL